MADLGPPPECMELVDSEAHELASSSDEDAFVPAQEENDQFDVPMLRVERVDGNPAHGEVPGTEAYNMRTQDAQPDELEIIPEDSPISKNIMSREENETEHDTPGGMPIPTTIVEKVDPASPSHGDVPGTAAYDIRKADAEPDVVRTAPEVTRTDLEDQGFDHGVTLMPLREQTGEQQESERASPPQETKKAQTPQETGSAHPLLETRDVERMDDHRKSDDVAEVHTKDVDEHMDEVDDDDAFGDDFDDFEEGAEHDFDAFDEGTEKLEAEYQPVSSITITSSVPPVEPQKLLLSFDGLDNIDDIIEACQPYLDKLFTSRVNSELDPRLQPEINTSFLNERSQSLWAQLVAPPPLQPPDWVRSRMRRLFLVSLGVPVDLDEILPASKQKKLILPSTHFEERSFPRPPLGPFNGTVARSKEENNSSASINSAGSRSERAKRASLAKFDVNSARLLCSTTDAALGNLMPEELQEHVSSLEELTQRAAEVLELWLFQKKSAMGDKQAFEEVIENLVKHAQKIRK